MRKPIRMAGLMAILAVPLATRGAEPPVPPRTLPQPVAPVISTHQINRYEAINKLQQTLKDNPKSLADWVILGELAHEVALDVPADQAVKYSRMSRDAYEKALALDPDNPGLKAAVQFAQDQENDSEKFNAARAQGAAAYLDARRRDLAATNYTPTLRVYGTPIPFPFTRAASTTPATTVVPTPAAAAPTPTTTTANPPLANTTPGATTANPALANTTTGTRTLAPPSTVAPQHPAAGVATAAPANAAVTTDPSSADTATANMGTSQLYTTYPTYLPYYAPQGQGSPYTFQQYRNSIYYIPNDNRTTPPMTMQRFLQQMPRRMLPPSEQPAGAIP